MTLLEAVKVTYEVIGQDITDVALRTIVAELESYGTEAVHAALARCRRELRKLTLSEILDRLPHGHPGPEEAWAIIGPSLDNEALSLAWTDQMAEAFGTTRHLADDLVAARMAFKEVYARLVAEARALGQAPVWRASLGWDPSGREAAQQEARTRNQTALRPGHAPGVLTDQR